MFAVAAVDQSVHKSEAINTLLDNWSRISESGADPRVVLGRALKGYDEGEFKVATLQAVYDTQKYLERKYWAV